MVRSLLLGIGIAVAAAIGAGGWWWYGHRAPPPTQWQGYADADFVKVGPTQQGLLTALNVARGDQVAAGAPLFSQDDTADRAARDQAARQVHQAQEQLANLQAASKPTEIEQAEANLADARATLARTKADLERGEFLVSTGTMAKETLDQRRADFRSATAKVAALEAALAQARAPYGRAAEIEAQQAAMRASQGRARNRRMAAVAAPRQRAGGGRIADVLARPGETMAAGAPVVSLLPPGNIFVRFFIPESDLGRHASRRSRRDRLRQLPGGFVRHDLVHRAASRIHAAGDLQRREQGEARLHDRGAAARRIRRRCSIPASP